MSKSQQILNDCIFTACKGKQLAAELATARTQLLEYEQSEAAVCPEDMGVNEYVRSLLDKIATAKAENNDLCGNIDAARQELEDYLKGSVEKKLRAELDKYRWIPVGERLPEEYGEYEVWDKYGNVHVAEWCPVIGGSWTIVQKILCWRHRVKPSGQLCEGFWLPEEDEE